MSDNRTWLATVLFMDIFSYSLIPVNQQLKVKLHFQNIVAREIDQLEETDTIRLDTGDGMAICYLGDPERMYPIARKLRDDFASLPEGSEYNYKVRLGLNLGPVKIVEDLNHERNCIGSGINDAERVMSFAAENQLLVSRSYFEIVSKMSQDYAQELKHVGLRADKHDQQHDIYELAVEVVRVSDFPRVDTATSAIDRQAEETELAFDPEVIERIRQELHKYIKKDEADARVEEAVSRATNLPELCALLMESIESQDDRYSFDQYLKYYGYSGYSR